MRVRPQPVSVSARVETPAVYDDEAGGNADADDPAVWVDPHHAGRSLVISTLKEAGLDVYGLDGKRLQHIAAPAAPGEDAAPGRFNNVDVVHGFELGGKRPTSPWSATAAGTVSGSTRSTRPRWRRAGPR
ncbi:phytase [Streptomyces sp. MS1.AVA.1]|uniref:Phytase n=1 Tax=Streptomyces machairae TaxID=3134109 RepID=A0ABU8UTH9_9ACTN